MFILATVLSPRRWRSPQSADSAWRLLGSLALRAALYGATAATKLNGAVIRRTPTLDLPAVPFPMVMSLADRNKTATTIGGWMGLSSGALAT